MIPKLTDDAVSVLPLESGRAELLEEIMSTVAPDRQTAEPIGDNLQRPNGCIILGEHSEELRNRKRRIEHHANTASTGLRAENGIAAPYPNRITMSGRRSGSPTRAASSGRTLATSTG